MNHKQIKQDGLHGIGFPAFLTTSFLGAFNDNCFKLLLTCFAMHTLNQSAQHNYIPLSGALFALPYLICSSYAGYISDRITKRRVMIWAKWLELVIMTIGLWLFRVNAVNSLLIVLFLMGAQSALYSPAKYGYLPETLSDTALPSGNGMTQLCTFIAIIIGTWAGGMVSEHHGGDWWIGAIYCVAVAGIGVITSYMTGKTPPGNPNAEFEWNPVATHIRTFNKIKRDPVLILSLFGNTYFWFVAALFQSNLPMLVKYDIMRGDKELGFLLGAVGLGIGVGCAACGALSRGKIEFGLVIPGGLMMGLSSILMGILGKWMFTATIFSALLGFFAGFYQLPLSTSMQKHSPPASRGSCLALGNAVDCISMLSAYAVQWILIKPLGLNARGVFVILGAITLVVVIIAAAKVPALARRTRALFAWHSYR